MLQQTDRRSDAKLHGRLINLVELPALIRLSEEEVMRKTLHCVSLCHPGVHVFLLIIPDSPLNNEDKAEIEEIQRIFSSRINKHIMILIMQNSEHQTELNEETQSVIENFGVRHNFFGPKTQVSTLMENIEKMLEENRGELFSTETFLEAQMKKRMKFEEMKKKIHSLQMRLLPKGLFDTELTNKEILREISSCISMILPGPHVFLLLIPLGRFTQEEAKQMEREKQEQQMNILIDRVKESEEEIKKLEEEKERMKIMMEEERQNQDKERKRREEELKKEIKEQEKEQREMRDEMRREREEMRKEKESVKKEREKLKTEYDTEIDRLMNRIENHETERKRREEEFIEREEQYKTLMKEKEELDEERERREQKLRELEERYQTLMKEKKESEEKMHQQMKREREEWEKQKLEEKTRREEEDEKKEKEQRDLDEFNQRLKQERERMEREKEDVQSKHEEEENKMKILMKQIHRDREDLVKKHEEEKD
ncbi:GTPase IMAP family member 8-like protein [Labeo rohita]|uniref:GTPase IMAP family member 8-like protein n=1 Tax=Labeo rohita TaxID=84645 RepID=A0A498M0G8_LABRO|nr:GTPase IMAP family member 8-like protein [Labeo rohita]